MSSEKKLVKEITPMEEDFARWYTDIVKKAELMDYSSVKGCMILEPYGYAIWENIQKILDTKFKKTGHKNIAMPLLIPESLLQKEKDHIAGFAPEVAWVTQGGNEKLQERLCIRPTSEVLFCEHFAKKVESWRDLPKLYNQWCSVVRWEKTSRPFLRSVEFYWQEGHTIHETAAEAKKETEQMLNIYKDFFENELAMPIFEGQKTEKEKFAGAQNTYTIEAMMHDGKALQSATSHYFGNGFAKAFNITFQNKENKPEFVYQTSWGLSTRAIGGIIMVHGDNEGLVLPPAIAPIQIIIIPIAIQKNGVLEKANEVLERLQKNFRAEVDSSEKSPGWKFAEYEMKGVPLRLELGPKDIEKNQCVIVRRDTREKIFLNFDELETKISEILENYRKSLYEKAKHRNQTMLRDARDFEEFEKFAEIPGFIEAMWCGNQACEDKIKDKFGITSRCILPKNERISEKCVCCGKDAKKTVLWGKAY